MYKSRRMRWAGCVACLGKRGNPEGKRPLGRPRCRWEDNIKIDLGEIGWVGMEWIYVAYDRDHWNTVMNVPLNVGKFLSG
jgi:hypothetical protein